MVVVLVERESNDRFSAGKILALEKAASPCQDLYRVRSRLHLLSKDGTRLACVFEAPDLEAMRAVLRSVDANPPKHLWAANVYAGPGEGAADALLQLSQEAVVAVAERSFAEPVRFEDIQGIEDNGSWCLNVHGVTHIRSYFSFDRCRMLCLYAARDAESVRIANRRIELPFDRVWGATLILPPQLNSAASRESVAGPH